VTKEVSDAKGVSVGHYDLPSWYAKVSAETKQWIRNNYNKWLKNELATQSLKVLRYSEIEEALHLSATRATEGKITIVPN
jgi:hypothetical protein